MAPPSLQLCVNEISCVEFGRLSDIYILLSSMIHGLNHGRATLRVTEFRSIADPTSTPAAAQLLRSRVCAGIQDCQSAPQMIASAHSLLRQI